MSEKIQMAVRVEKRIKRAVERVCRTRGLIMSRFVEDALLDRLEELEDQEDLKKILREPTRPFSEVLNDLKKNRHV